MMVISGLVPICLDVETPQVIHLVIIVYIYWLTGVLYNIDFKFIIPTVKRMLIGRHFIKESPVLFPHMHSTSVNNVIFYFRATQPDLFQMNVFRDIC